MIAAVRWQPIEDEARSLRVAAARARCRVVSLVARPSASGPVLAGRVECPDGWAAARMLVAAAAEDAKTVGARDLALELRRGAPDDESFARRVHAYVLEHVAFVREAGEVFAAPWYTLGVGAGDCDDHARLTYAILAAGGVPARLAFLSPKGSPGPSHVVAQAGAGGAWHWLETTVAARFGEHPMAAATRLGIRLQRRDIATEVRTMSEKDLPPIPPTFHGGDVTRDARALADLGYLCDSFAAAPVDARDPVFRKALLAFQVARGVAPDGLIGPESRGEIAEAMGALRPTRTFTHARARDVLRAAYGRLFGRTPSEGELDFGLATAFFETAYGRAGAADWANPGQFARWAARGRYNWGALERARVGGACAPGSATIRGHYPALAPTVAVELGEGVDAGRPVCFLLFDSDDAAAEAFLRVWGAPDTLAAAATGSASEVSRAMRRHGYYEGFWRKPGGLDAAHPASKGFREAASEADAEARNVADYAGRSSATERP